ncbi:MAG: DMT family transporter [Erysipelotrichaceae bacterium]|nr:DMT family transporter [Erysipelotrichaceae bacterium]
MENQSVRRSRLPLIPAALFCCFMWGSAPPFIKWGYETLKIDSTGSILLFAGIRFFLAGIMVLAFAGLSKNKEVRHPEKCAGPILCLALFQTAGQYFFYYIGLASSSSVMGAILSSVSGFFALILSAWVFRLEKMTPWKLAGMLLGLGGIVVLNLKGLKFSFSMAGEGMLLLSQVSSAMSAVLIQIFSRKYDPVSLSGWQFAAGGLALTAAGLLMGGRIVWNPKGIGILCWLAFVSAAAYTLWGILLKEYPVSSVGVFSASIPLFGIVFSVVLLNEASALTWNAAAALILIAGGVLAINRRAVK